MDYLKKSRIEEVLIAILGKGMVTSQLISRIEKILDAIRTDGSYDGPVMSEVEEILVCILNGEPFEKPTHSRIAAMLKAKANGGEYTELRKSRAEELIFEWINAVESATYTGTLPATLQTVEGYLESYKIYGNTEQDGTPTPENPIMPSGCGVRTENLFDKNAMVVPAYLDSQYGTYKLSSGNSKSALIRCLPNTDYSFTAFSRTFRVSFFDHKPANNDSPLSRHIYDFSIYGTHSRTVSSPSSAQYVVLFFYNSSVEALDYTVDDILSAVMIVEGSTAPSTYIPYGYKLPLTVNGVEYPIYPGEAETTRRIKKLVLTGEEEFNKNTATSSNYLYYRPRNALLPNSIEKTPLICNELPVTNEAPASQIGISSNNNFNVIYVNFGADVMNAQPSGNTVAGLKEYLASQYAAGTPVTVWYALAEPETAVVNEPLMKIGDYADTIDSTQANVQIPTVAGETTISWAGEGLAPSEVELTYSKPKSKWKE